MTSSRSTSTRTRKRGEDVTIGAEKWQTWTDSDGDYAVARALDGPKGAEESVLVVGSAPERQVRRAGGVADRALT